MGACSAEIGDGFGGSLAVGQGECAWVSSGAVRGGRWETLWATGSAFFDTAAASFFYGPNKVVPARFSRTPG